MIRFFIISILFFLSGCSSLFFHGLEPADIRIGINECTDNELEALVYCRSDGSVLSIRCTPKKTDNTRIIIMRPRVPMSVIRPFFEYKETE